MHACLWGKYWNKLEKLMSWSLISLNLHYCNHNLISYNHSQVITWFTMGGQLWSFFSQTILQSLPKEA